MNSKGPETAQDPDPSSLVLHGPNGTETDSPQTRGCSDDDDDDDEHCWQIPLSESETEADSDSTRKKGKMSDSNKNAEMGCKASKTRKRSFQQICLNNKVQVKITSECVDGKKASVSAASKLRVDTGEKPFECSFCRKCFTRNASRQLHMRIHTGEKPFKCDVCSKCFMIKHHLQSHMIIHSGAKPFAFHFRHGLFHAGKGDGKKHYAYPDPSPNLNTDNFTSNLVSSDLFTFK
uniref:C2H2-type domain-containing protein n=1 Tax=Gouania willdenowi TaxID=441366 RepID=A0A8C5EWF1_GOUWI